MKKKLIVFLLLISNLIYANNENEIDEDSIVEEENVEEVDGDIAGLCRTDNIPPESLDGADDQYFEG